MTPIPKHWSETESPLDDFVYLVKSLTGPICIFGTLGSIVFLVGTGKVDLKHSNLVKDIGSSGLIGGSIVTALTRGRKGSGLMDIAAGLAANHLKEADKPSITTMADPLARKSIDIQRPSKFRDTGFPDYQVDPGPMDEPVSRNEDYYLSQFNNRG